MSHPPKDNSPKSGKQSSADEKTLEIKGGQGARQVPTLTPEQIEQLNASLPMATVSWNKKEDRPDPIQTVNAPDALSSIPSRGTVFVHPKTGVLSILMPTKEDDESSENKIEKLKEKAAEQSSMETAAFLPTEHAPVIDIDDDEDCAPNWGPSVPSRQDLLAEGTSRLPVIRTTDSAMAGLIDAEADFILRDVIGKGGQGEVWRAWQVSLAREVAIKRLSSKDADVVEFLKEAYTSAELDHPNIVPVYDLGRVQEAGMDRPLLAMKLLSGRPWDELIKDDRTSENFVLEEFLARHLPTLISVANAVAYAHSKGIIHRDLKPQQVVIGKFGEIFLIDWGLAVCLHDEVPRALRDNIPKHNTLQTATNCTGTPAYMAPEQTAATTSGLGFHTDVYLLGSILFELVSGRPPHLCNTGQESFFMAAVNDHHPINKDCPADLRRLIEACLETDPENRPPDVESVRGAIEDYLSGSNRRRESRAVVECLEDELQAANGEYARLAECDHLMNRARALWEDNPDLPALRRNFLNQYVQAALDQDDLSLARLQAERMAEGEDRDRFQKAIVDRERIKHRHAIQRRIAVVATATLLVVAVIFGLIAENQRRYARKQADEALYGQYLSNIQFAQILLDDGRVGAAQEYLVDTPEALRHWEWGYLLRRCQMEIAYHAERQRTPIDVVFTDNPDDLFLEFEEGPPSRWDYAGDGKLTPVSEIPQGASGESSEESAAEERNDAPGWLSPDGQIRVALNDEGGLDLIGTKRGNVFAKALGHNGKINHVDFHPFDDIFASASDDRTVRFWDIATGDEIARLAGFPSSVLTAKFDREGNNIVTISDDRSVRIWNSFQVLKNTILKDDDIPVNRAVFSPDRTRVATACGDGFARVWVADTRRMAQEFDMSPGEITGVDFSSDGERLITAGPDATLRIWDVVAGALKTSVDVSDAAPPNARLINAAFLGSDQWAFASRSDGKAFDISLRGNPKSELIHHATTSGDPFICAISPDAKQLAFAESSHEISLKNDIGDQKEEPRLLNNRGEVSALRFSPDSRLLASASLDGTLRIWECENGEELLHLEGHNGPVRDVSFSPDGARLITASDDGTAKIWDAVTGRELITLSAHTNAVTSASFSGDAAQVVTSSKDGAAIVWNAAPY